MKLRTTIRLISSVCLIALIGLSLGTLGHTFAARAVKSGATQPFGYTITAGWGNDDYAANVYTPQTLNIYTGDTVTWRNQGLLEPHTISFGPMPLLTRLARGIIQPVRKTDRRTSSSTRSWRSPRPPMSTAARATPTPACSARDRAGA